MIRSTSETAAKAQNELRPSLPEMTGTIRRRAGKQHRALGRRLLRVGRGQSVPDGQPVDPDDRQVRGQGARAAGWSTRRPRPT